MDYRLLWLFIGISILGPLIFSAGTLYKLFISFRIPTTWISALPDQGWVEVLGRIRGDPIKSLLYKYDCAYWQVEVKEYQSSGRGSGRWKTVHRQSSGSFFLNDMTGKVQVLDGNASLIMNNETVLDKPDAEIKALLENLGIKTKGFLGFDKKLRVYERLIAPDEEILVLGRIQKSETPITISGKDIKPQLISNLSRGEMNKALFWQTVRPMILPSLVGIVFLLYYVYSVLK